MPDSSAGQPAGAPDLTIDEVDEVVDDLNPGFPDEDGAETEDTTSDVHEALTGSEATDPGKPPRTVFDSLRDDYAEAVEAVETGERSEDFEILPGRFHGNLGIRTQNVTDATRRKRGREMQRRGQVRGREAVLNAQAQLIADATSTMLARDEAGEWIPLHEHPDTPVDFRSAPIRFDDRLAAIIGFDNTGTEYGCVRMVYRGNPSALSEFFGWIDAWLKEDLVMDDGEDEGGERPT